MLFLFSTYGLKSTVISLAFLLFSTSPEDLKAFDDEHPEDICSIIPLLI